MIDYREALDLLDGVPGAIRDELYECPETGSGERRVFRWIFYMVNRLFPYCTADETLELLEEASADCGRDTDSDIRGALKVVSGHGLRSSGGDIHSSHGVRKKGKVPSVDYARVVEFYRKHGDYEALLKYSGTTPELKATRSLVWLNDLYRPGDILGPGTKKYDTIVAPLEYWGQLLEENSFDLCSELCFLTPNPYRPEATGRRNCGILERRYFVLECDIAGTERKKDGSVLQTKWHPILEKTGCTGWDLQAGVIFHLFEMGYPIVSIVHSGNKSLHVWCSARDLTEEQILQMIDYAARLGADDAGKAVSQFMRLPNPDHSTRKQPLIYHNPSFINK